jgi:hypothetical protein
MPDILVDVDERKEMLKGCCQLENATSTVVENDRRKDEE